MKCIEAKIFPIVAGLAVLALPLGSALAQAGVTRTGWEMNSGQGVIYKNTAFSGFGTLDNYSDAAVPPETDAGWVPAPDAATINFGGAGKSAIPHDSKYCRKAVDYTYFQTFVTVPASGKVTEFKISFDGMDDGSRITVYNEAHPAGIVVEGSYVSIRGTGTSDLKDLMVEGRNRIVITQVDVCPNDNELHSAVVQLNGEVVQPVAAPKLPEAFKLLAYSINDQVRDSAGVAPDYHVAIENGLGKILKGVNVGTPFEIVKVEGERIVLRVAQGSSKGKFLKGEDNRATFGDSEYDKAAQFIVRAPLESTAGKFVSFESVAFPGQYLRHQGYQLKLDSANAQSASLLRRDATFRFEEVALPDDAQTCFDMVQGKVAWNRAGANQWNESNVRNLCAGSTDPAATIACFKQGIQAHDDWGRAIKECGH